MRRLIILPVLAAALAASGTVTTRDYVHDGLIAHWDARFSGGGTVRSDNTPWRSVPAAERPPLVGFRKCRGVHLAGGSFRGAPGRAVEFFDCRRVLMKAIELVLQDETRGFVAAVDSPGAVVSACSYWAGDPLLGIQDPNVRKIRDHHD